MSAVPPKPPAAVVFDNDGLLLDTEAVWTRAEEQLFARRGREFTIDHKRQLVGTSEVIARGLLEEMLGEPGKALSDELHLIVMDEILQGADPRPGAVELIAELRGRVPLGLASNSPPAFVTRALEISGFDGSFDEVLSGHEVARAKPAPDVYLEICRRLGADPAACVALEDSPTGVTAARDAGMFVIGVPSLDGIELDADLVCETLADPRVRAAVGLDRG